MNLLSELKRRNVFRVAIAYLVFAWLVLQVADVLFPTLHLPLWSLTLVAVLLAIGLIPVLIFAWAYELTPEGLKRESEVDRSRTITHVTARKLDYITVGMLVLVLAVVVADRTLFDRVAVERRSTDASHEFSIAVLPFDDLSDTHDQEYFGDGLAEELLNRLAGVEGFRVAGRTSSFAFKDRPDDLRVIGEKLNVTTILEGSVRKSGDRLRITAQLIDVDNGYHLWSETFDRRMENIFKIQDEIALAVVRALQVTLMGSARAVELPAAPVTDNRAYDLYLRGRHELWKLRPVPLREAQALFEQAIEIDPAYAPAYAGLSDSLVFQVNQGYAEETKAFEEAEKALDRARALDSGSAEVLASLGLLRRQQGRIEASRDALRAAIALNPNNAPAHIWLSNTFPIGDPPEALRLAQRAYAIDPLERVVIAQYFYRLLDFGRSDEAFALARAMHEEYPESGWGYELAGDGHFQAGRLDEALKSYYLAYRTAPDRAFGFAGAAFALLDLGAIELAEPWTSELERTGPELPDVVWQRALLAFERSQPAEAVRVFEEAAARRTDPWFDQQLGVVHMLTGDFVAARRAMERALLQPGQDRPAFDRARWPDLVDYAFVLLRTDDQERADELIAEAQLVLQQQMEAGVVNVPDGPFDLYTYAAMLHALSGRPREAVEDLRRSAQRGALNCLWCLRTTPQFDSLRDDPEFESLLEEQEARRDALRQRLVDEGMLITPAQVLGLAQLAYDPFSR